MKFLLLALSAVFIITFSSEIPAQKRKPVRRPVAKSKKIDLPPDAPILPQSVAFTPGAKDADGWSVYESRADLFKIAFPPTPVVTDENNDGDGKKSGNRYYVPEPVTPSRLNLTAVVLDLGVTILSDDQKRELYTVWINSLMEADRTGVKGVMVMDKEFVITGGYGVEVIVDRGDYRFHGRAICKENRFYQLGVGSVAPGDKKEGIADSTKWSRKFLDSFQMTIAPPAPPDPFYGKLENGVYDNTVGGFSLTVPVGWIDQPVDRKPTRDSEIASIYKTDDAAHNRDIDRSLEMEKTILQITKKPAGSPQNSVLGIGMGKAPKNATSLEANTLVTRKIFAESSLKPELTPTVRKTFGRVKVNSFDMVSNYKDTLIKQRLYITMNRGYLISFVIAYWSDVELLELERSIATLKFK